MHYADYRSLKKIYFDTITIVSTRRCNLNCRHCFRGDAENVNIEKGYIDKLLCQCEKIKTLCFTGGEPFLEPDVIDYAIDYLDKNNIPLERISITTNGTIYNDMKVIKALQKAYSYIKKNYKDGYILITISNDKYHNNNLQKFYKAMEKHFPLEQYSKVLFTDNTSGRNPVNKGKGKNLVEATQYTFNYPHQIDYMEYGHASVCLMNRKGVHLEHKEQVVVNCNIVLDVTGKIFNSTDLQWDECTEDNGFYIGDMANENISEYEMIKRYNAGKPTCPYSQIKSILMSDVEEDTNEQLYLNTFKKMTDVESDNTFLGQIKRQIDSGAYTERYKRAYEEGQKTGKYKSDLLSENLDVMENAMSDVIDRAYKVVSVVGVEELIKMDSEIEASQTGEELYSIIERRKKSKQYEQEKEWANDLLQLVAKINIGQSKDSHMKSFVLGKLLDETENHHDIYRAVSEVHRKYSVPYSFIERVIGE